MQVFYFIAQEVLYYLAYCSNLKIILYTNVYNYLKDIDFFVDIV